MMDPLKKLSYEDINMRVLHYYTLSPEYYRAQSWFTPCLPQRLLSKCLRTTQLSILCH